MVCDISTSKTSIHRRSMIMWVFTYFMESLHQHNYKLNTRHSTWTSYMVTISPKNMLVSMGYQTLGTIGASTTHTTDVPSQKTVQWGETRLELFCDFFRVRLDTSSQQVPWYKLSRIRLHISPQQVPMVQLQLSRQRGLRYSRATNLGIYSQSPQARSIINAADLPAPKVIQDIVRHDLP